MKGIPRGDVNKRPVLHPFCDLIPFFEKMEKHENGYDSFNTGPDVTTTASVRGRRRGDHSTVCKCRHPFYFRPPDWKPLKGIHGHAYASLVARDRKTGLCSLRRRVSADPIFIALRTALGRKRGFPKVRRDLLDAVFVLLISAADLATGIVVLNITEISRQLSPARPDGSPDPSQYVVVSRLSRLLNELERFGILENPRPEFDFTGKVRFPKHVIITDLGWSLTGIDMARFRHEREVRLNNEALKEAQQRWQERNRLAVLRRRQQKRAESRLRKQLQGLSPDEQKRHIGERVYRQLGPLRTSIPPQRFGKLVYEQLYQLQLFFRPQKCAPPVK